MRAILINTIEKTVTEIETDGTLGGSCKAIPCERIMAASYLGNDDVIYVNEDMPSQQFFGSFSMKYGMVPLFGNGLVVGTSKTGKTVSCKSSVGEIRKSIHFGKVSS